MAEGPDTQKLQTEIVVAVARCIDQSWERIIVHYEVLDEDGTRMENENAFYVHKDESGTHSTESFDLSKDAQAKINALRDHPQPGQGDKWGTCILKIDPPGHFKFNFSYDPPKRLNGIFDDEFRYYSRYLPHYLEEKGLKN